MSVLKYVPTIEECIEGSYKEGFELYWSRKGNTILIERSSITLPWMFIFNSIDCNITRDLKKYYPELTVIWT